MEKCEVGIGYDGRKGKREGAHSDSADVCSADNQSLLKKKRISFCKSVVEMKQ